MLITTILNGQNKMKQRTKYILIILLTILSTLIIERVIFFIYTYNPVISYEDAMNKVMERIENNDFAINDDSIVYSSKINREHSLLENCFHVEHIIEYKQFMTIGYDMGYSIDDASLHDAFLADQEKFQHNSILDYSQTFYSRIREALRCSKLDRFKISSRFCDFADENNDFSYYVVHNRFYKKQNDNKEYYLVQIFVQNEDEFLYISYLNRGTLTENYSLDENLSKRMFSTLIKCTENKVYLTETDKIEEKFFKQKVNK